LHYSCRYSRYKQNPTKKAPTASKQTGTFLDRYALLIVPEASMAVDLNVLVRHEGALFVCNPYSHTHHWCGLHRDTHTDRPASYRDVFMALSSASTELLDQLAEEYTPQELADVAATLGYSEKEIAEYQRQEDAGELDPHENYFKTFLVAEIACAVIQHKGAVDIPGILSFSNP
jgi:hypothetical protein